MSIANVSAFDLETAARTVYAATPADIKTMAKVAGYLEAARLALHAGDEHACIDSFARACDQVWLRSQTAHKATMAMFG